MTGAAPPEARAFHRDALTWLGYLLLFSYGFTQSSLGPIMPFLRAELGFNYTVASLHLSTFAAGMIAAGSSAPAVVRRWSRTALLWTGAAGLAAGVVGLMLAPDAWASVGSAGVMGWLASWMLIAVQAALSERHGDMGATALIEANVGASVGSGAVALALTAAAGVGADWRVVYVVPLALLAVAALRSRAESFDSVGPGELQPGRDERLPLRFWIFFVLIFLGVGIEWTIGFWAASFLTDEAGLSSAGATAAVTALFGAMIASRMFASRLARSGSAERLLILSFALTGTGFPLFWLAPSAILQVPGLVVVGLGTANLFPLGLSLALAAVPGNRDAGSARCSTAGGIALVVFPLLVGSIADRTSIFLAFAIVPVLLALAAVTGLAAARASS